MKESDLNTVAACESGLLENLTLRSKKWSKQNKSKNSKIKDYLILLYGARFSGHIRGNRGMLTSFQFCLVNLQFKILCQIV